MPSIGESVAQHARRVARGPVELAREIHDLRPDGIVTRRRQRRRMHGRTDIRLGRRPKPRSDQYAVRTQHHGCRQPPAVTDTASR